MSDVSIYKGHLTAAIAAMGSGDWATAGDELIMAETALAALPDSEVSDDRIEWGRQLTSLQANVRGRQSGSVGIRRTKVKYVRVSD